MSKATIAFFVLFGSLVLAACGVAFRENTPGMPGFGNSGSSRFASNGERIYFTGTNDQGQRIGYTGGPSFGGMMMGQQLSCSSCHGPDGKGGPHTMHMEMMDAPDIRFVTLSGDQEAGEHTEDLNDEHAAAHSGEYSLETFRQAVVNGQHPGGESLERDMPRWQLSDQDLQDLFAYLKTLD